MPTTDISVCYHCGDRLGGSVLQTDGKSFCCAGCQSVYSLLKQSELGNYYSFNSNPGLKGEAPRAKEEFLYLDKPEIQAKLLKYSDTNSSLIMLQLPQIHCSSCIFLLEHLSKLNDAIAFSQVNFVAKTALIKWDISKLPLSELVMLLDKIGYPPRITLSQTESSSLQKQDDHLALIKIGVAGFCFGNIMLLSFPEYFGYEWRSDAALSRIFDMLNMLLSLPLFFYASMGFHRSALAGLRAKKLNIDVPISLGIVVMFVRSVADVVFDWGPGYFDTLGGLIFFMLVGRYFQDKTYSAIGFDHTYTSFFPIAATVIQRDGTSEEREIKTLKPGETILVRNGGLIPADALLLSADAQIDYSFVTGESVPTTVSKEQRIFGGGRNVGKPIELCIEKEVSQGYLTSLWNRQYKQNEQKDTLEKTVDKISAWFTIAILFIALAAALYWLRSDPQRALNAFTAVLIITCPCALALSSPFTLGNMMRILGKHGLYLKNARVIEWLNACKHIVFDKTGTLTEAGQLHPVYEGNPISDEQYAIFKAMLFQSSHPLSKAICKTFNFQSVNESLTIHEENGKGLECVYKETTYCVGSKAFCTGKQENVANGTRVYLSVGHKVLGFFKFSNTYRAGLNSVLNSLAHDYKLSLLSGDNSSEMENLKTIFPPQSNLLFDQSPAEKAHYVQSREKLEQHAIMVGDGLNDSGALLEATVGIALSEKAGHFSPACDAVIISHSFHKFHRFLQFTKWAPRIIYFSFIVSLAYNALGLYYALPGTMHPVVAAIVMPISSVTIVVITTVSTRLCELNYLKDAKFS